MILPTLLATLALARLAPLVQAGITASGVTGTVYYDGTGSCGKKDDVDENAGDYSTGLKAHVGACGYSVDQIGDNRLVAFDVSLMQSGAAQLCGKEIQVTKADGTPFEFSEGPLFIGDTCIACAGGVRLDMSAKALVEIGGDCKANPPGLSYQVLDTMAGPEFSSNPAGLVGGYAGGNGSTSASSAAVLPGGASSSVPGVPTTSAVGVSASIPGGPASSAPAIPSVPTVPADPASQHIANSATVAQPTVPSVVPTTAAAVPSVTSGVPSVPSVPVVPTAPTVPAGIPSAASLPPGVASSPSLPAGISSSPFLPAGVTTTGLPGMALFAEEGSGTDATCKRRKRRRLSKSH